MRRPGPVIVAWLLVEAALVAHTAPAPSDLAAVATDASLIVRGRVTEVRAIRLPQREVSTAATVAIEAVLKGDAGRHVTVIVPGGVLGRTRTVMIGAPELRAGDHAVFFLARGPDGLWRPVGLAMGLYRIEAPRGVAVVHAPLLLGRTASVGAVVRGARDRQPMPLDAFETLVGDAVGPARQRFARGRP